MTNKMLIGRIYLHAEDGALAATFRASAEVALTTAEVIHVSKIVSAVDRACMEPVSTEVYEAFFSSLVRTSSTRDSDGRDP